MKTAIVWKEAMSFDGIVENLVVGMDAKPPLGKGVSPTPKELVAMGLGGCTAMDVIALLKKHKQPVESFSVEVEIQPSSGKQPIVFESAKLTFLAEGAIEPSILNESVMLSQTKYCGVSAMLSAAFPIDYRVILNGSEVGSGSAKFD